MTVMIKKIGGSFAVVIPKAVARDMNLSEGTCLDMSTSADGIVLRRRGTRPRRPLAQLVAQIDPRAYRKRNREMLGDPPVGREVG